jgi:hypothetical protein
MYIGFWWQKNEQTTWKSRHRWEGNILMEIKETGG